MSDAWKARLAANSEPHWGPTIHWFAYVFAFFGLQGVMLLLLNAGLLWACVPVILVLAYIKHCHLIAFHETSHGNLCPWPWLNEAIGHFIATLGLMSLSLYRAVHWLHHAYIGSPRDEELWPFVDPTKPRWFRRLSATLEMCFGLIYTPCLFMRCFFKKDSPIKNPTTRRRIRFELMAIVVFWGTVLTVTAWMNAWLYLLFLYVLPSWLAGNLQTVRKYVEHLGVMGPPPLGVTRSIVPEGAFDRFIVFTLFHEPYHGIHHRYAHLPQAVFPEFTDLLTPTEPGQLAPYRSYRQAIGEMIRSLHDPRTGSQWIDLPATTCASQDSTSLNASIPVEARLDPGL